MGWENIIWSLKKWVYLWLEQLGAVQHEQPHCTCPKSKKQWLQLNSRSIKNKTLPASPESSRVYDLKSHPIFHILKNTLYYKVENSPAIQCGQGQKQKCLSSWMPKKALKVPNLIELVKGCKTFFRYETLLQTQKYER